MRLSINKRLINKNELNDKGAFSAGFQSVDVSASELAASINKGYAYSSQFSKGRKAENFVCSDIISADFDGTRTIEDALGDDFVKRYATLFYTTPSHTEADNRFRIVFELPRTIVDAKEYARAATGLSRRLNSDPAATDAARVFYGSRQSNPILLGNRLDEATLEHLITLGESPRNLSDSIGTAGKAVTRANVPLSPDAVVRTAKGENVAVKSLPPATSIFCPFHSDRSPSAFTTRSRFDDVGIHCSTCQSTFWVVPPVRDYDFFYFDKITRRLYEDESFDELFDDPDRQPIKFDEPRQHLVVKDRFLPDVPLRPGWTLIKSPKGSGKTKYLGRFVNECRRKHLRILMVGHRRALLRTSAANLGMTYYMEEKANQTGNYSPPTSEYAVCMDSMPALLEPKQHKYSVVIIDEAEQVFAHLASATLAEKRRSCYAKLRHYVRNADYLIVLDADLNRITLRAILGFDTAKPGLIARCVLNDYSHRTDTIDLFQDRAHMVGELMADIAAGRRCFVCCNSKKQVEEFEKAIVDAYPDRRTLAITSENVQKHERFIQEIQTEILNYDVVLSSPAIGTGIDITFTDEIQHVDAVYGFFEARITTHYDIDQQLSRVRNPKRVCVWISPERFNFETEHGPIVQEILEAGVLPETLLRYDDDDGSPVYNRDDEFLNLYAEIIAAQRASKNDLRRHFRDLREKNGWTIKDVEKASETAKIGRAAARKGKQLRADDRTAALMRAAPLDSDALQAFRELRRKGELAADDLMRLERAEIERFYCRPITPELAEFDREGRTRDEVRGLESLLRVLRRGKSGGDRKRLPRVPLGFQVGINGNAQSTLLGKVFAAARVTDASSFDCSAVITTSTLVEFVKYCEKNKPKIEQVLGIDIRKDIRTKPMTQLQAFLSKVGMKTVGVGEVRTGGKKTYQYGIDPKRLEERLEIVHARALTSDDSPQ